MNDEHAPDGAGENDHRGTAASQPNTIKPGGGRRWVHAAGIKGAWQTRRNIVAVLLLIIFYGAPWVTVHGRPFIQLSFLDEVFYLIGQPILIYEFYHFVLLALLLVLTLFLASALLGRVWCGWACPQTIFIEQILLRIEAFFEGPAAHRIAAQGRPLTWQVVVRKSLKQAAFLLVSLSFAATLVAYFVGPAALLNAQPVPWTAVVFLAGLAWFDGAYWREQFCHIVCPYARFQSVMQDTATRTIGYDSARGEPRGRGKQRLGKGDCIDCGLCMRVCPSGIDIRQGASQLECTGCARCVDACDSIMTSVKKPMGLIRYDALGVFEHRERKSVLRPRVLVYAAGWCLLAGVGIALFLTRAPFHLRQIAARQSSPYVINGDEVQNLFNLKIANQTLDNETYELSLLEGVTGIRIATPVRTAPVKSGQEITMPVLLVGAKGSAGTTVRIAVTAVGIKTDRVIERTFLGPGSGVNR